MIKWMLHIANPITQSSIMFRRAAIAAIGGQFMREDFKYSDDYELYHRLLRHGNIVRLPEYLTVYRIHEKNTFRIYEETMIENAIKVLVPAYSAWFGDKSQDAALVVVRTLSARKPAASIEMLDRLGHYLEALIAGFAEQNELDASARGRITRSAAHLWWQDVSQAAENGVAGAHALFPTRIVSAVSWRPCRSLRNFCASLLLASPLLARVTTASVA